MKNIVIGGLLAILTGATGFVMDVRASGTVPQPAIAQSSGSQVSAEAPLTNNPSTHAVPAPVLLDVDKPLPAQLDLELGQRVFLYRRPSLGLEVTIHNGSSILSDVDKGQWPLIVRGRVLSGLDAVKPGDTVLEIRSRVVAPGTPTNTKKLKVHIQLAPVVHKIEFKAPYPQLLEVVPGDSIVFFVQFQRDPGLYDPFIYPVDAKTTDGKPGEAVETERGVKRLDVDNIQIARYNAKRSGQAEIVIRDFSGKIISTVKVSVK